MEWSWWIGVAVVAVIVVVSSLRWTVFDFVLDRFGKPRDEGESESASTS